ncbi:hypothetical protein [Xanthomonas sp. LMC-A-07]|uniref:hypothetical protein n=1 Tax=Xanthomonas sp. LMC-A-07 TaxID=3040329 RepID=UPI0025535FCD|nr:hypothetical protein [Xanthomonas sp. LMC-A-07]
MSYDISLYEPSFLRSAVVSGLGDWTAAPPFSVEVRHAIIDAAEAEGFIASPHPPGFIEFLQAQGVTPSTDYRLATSQYDLLLQVFDSSATLTVQANGNASSSIAFGCRFGQRLAKQLRLGYYDPQEGEVSYGEV